MDLRRPPFGLTMASVLEFGTDRTFNLRRFAFVTPGVKQVFLWIRPVRADAPVHATTPSRRDVTLSDAQESVRRAEGRTRTVTPA